MRTDYLIIKLEPILRKLTEQWQADYYLKPEKKTELTYCDKFTAKSNLDIVIKVNLDITDNGGHEENCLTVIEFDSCSVDKFEVMDEASNPVCDGQQIKDLVIFTNNFISHFYSKL